MKIKKISGTVFALFVCVFFGSSIVNAQTPSVACYSSKTNVGIGESVRWYASYSGGLSYNGGPETSPYFIWSGTDIYNTGTSSPFIDVTYSSLGQKNMNITYSTFTRDSVHPYSIIGTSVGRECNNVVNVIDKTPTITVVSPNGGEIYNVGDTLNVKWTSNNLSTSSVVSIAIEDTRKLGDTPEHYNYIAPSIFNSGNFSWVISTTSIAQMDGGNVYKVLVHSSDGLDIGSIEDLSDSTFSINSSVTPSCYNFPVNLQLHSTGSEVEKLQNFLLGNGFKISDLIHSTKRDKGYFGGSTYQALVKFQRSVGVEPTGYFGQTTRALINSRCYPIQ